MLRNHRVAQTTPWRGGQFVNADRWYPLTRLCPACGAIRDDPALSDRVFTCCCGYLADRGTNAAVSLARWGQNHHDDLHLDPRTPKQRGRANNARRRVGADQTALNLRELRKGAFLGCLQAALGHLWEPSLVRRRGV